MRDRMKTWIRAVPRQRPSVLAIMAMLGTLAAGPAFAQGWWPWEQERREQERRPPPREPAYRPPPAPETDAPSSSSDQWGGRRSICLQLEQRLVQENQRGARPRDLLPQIEADLRLGERAARAAQIQLDRNDCYDYFLFSKTLRRSRQCVDLAGAAEDARRRLGDLQAQRQDILSSSDRSYQDEIIRELARNNCGGNYAQEARKRDRSPFSSIWADEESGEWSGNRYGALPYATYRTLCVRLCDGYYFPVSFSTLPNHFERDAEACQSRCAAPAELYYHQNPGGSVEQMTAFRTQDLYTNLKSAFKYRKEFVQGCSCKAAEYNAEGLPAEDAPDESKRRAEAPGKTGTER